MIDLSVRGLLGVEWANGTNSGVDRCYFFCTFPHQVCLVFLTCFVLAFAHLKMETITPVMQASSLPKLLSLLITNYASTSTSITEEEA